MGGERASSRCESYVSFTVYGTKARHVSEIVKTNGTGHKVEITVIMCIRFDLQIFEFLPLYLIRKYAKDNPFPFPSASENVWSKAKPHLVFCNNLLI